MFGELFPPLSVRLVSTHPSIRPSLVQETFSGRLWKALAMAAAFHVLVGWPSPTLKVRPSTAERCGHFCPLLCLRKDGQSVAKGREHLRGENTRSECWGLRSKSYQDGIKNGTSGDAEDKLYLWRGLLLLGGRRELCVQVSSPHWAKPLPEGGFGLSVFKHSPLLRRSFILRRLVNHLLYHIQKNGQ